MDFLTWSMPDTAETFALISSLLISSPTGLPSRYRIEGLRRAAMFLQGASSTPFIINVDFFLDNLVRDCPVHCSVSI